jgi:putative MATE family efflux protein
VTSTNVQQTNPLLSGPIAPTILRLAGPTMFAMLASTLVSIAETSYVGQLGIPALAGLALVFPINMLQQMLSAGAMGGGVSSAVARAIGARDGARAQKLAFHAAVIGALAGLVLSAIVFFFGPAIFAALGGRGAALEEALAYARVFAPGVFFVWMTNTLASILRGGGDMRTPSFTILAGSALQIVIGGVLGLGLGPFPKLGMAGVALGLTLSFVFASAILYARLARANAPVRLVLRGQTFDGAIFADILKVGALACAAPLQSVATVLILTRFVAHYGVETLAGYGIGSRLEFLLIPIAFAIGVACVPMVGMAIGAGDVARARKVAWTGAVMAALGLSAIGLVFFIWPNLWGAMFTSAPHVLSAQFQYMRWTALFYPFFGFGLCLYFASQGSGKVLGPVLAASVRLIVVAAGGYWAYATQQPAETLFAIVGLALAAYGLATGAAVYLVSWAPKPTR